MYEENYWQAVLTKDKNADGTFVYAVRSTGIYCKPSCSSRKPKREQVLFFELPEAAEQAGFRPCRRCQSQETTQHQVELVQRACRYIEAHLESSLTLTDLGTHVNMSPHHLQRIFKRIMGITPRQYAEASRLGELKALLKEGENVTQALYEAGYSSSSRLYERAPSQLGMTPTSYRHGGQGMHINYTIENSPLGRLLVAATEKGICSINLGDSDTVLKTALFNEYPAAEITPGGTDLSQEVNTLLCHLNGEQPHLDLPLDVQATAFQWRVWQELRTIPYGSTRSYSQVAKAIGQPNATRAVARACATNPVPLLIPCHRVIREDGTLGGYRLGRERKQHLLEQEKAKTGR